MNVLIWLKCHEYLKWISLDTLFKRVFSCSIVKNSLFIFRPIADRSTFNFYANRLYMFKIKTEWGKTVIQDIIPMMTFIGSHMSKITIHKTIRTTRYIRVFKDQTPYRTYRDVSMKKWSWWRTFSRSSTWISSIYTSHRKSLPVLPNSSRSSQQIRKYDDWSSNSKEIPNSMVFKSDSRTHPNEKSQVSETNIARHEMRIISITDQSDEYIIDNIQLGDVYFHASALESSLYIRMITNFVSSSRNSYIFNHDDPLTHFHSLFNSVVLNRLWRLWTIYFFDIRSNIIFFVADIEIVLIDSRISIMCFAFIWLRIWWWLEYSFRFFDILFRNNYHRITNLSKI